MIGCRIGLECVASILLDISLLVIIKIKQEQFWIGPSPDRSHLYMIYSALTLSCNTRSDLMCTQSERKRERERRNRNWKLNRRYTRAGTDDDASSPYSAFFVRIHRGANLAVESSRKRWKVLQRHVNSENFGPRLMLKNKPVKKHYRNIPIVCTSVSLQRDFRYYDRQL